MAKYLVGQKVHWPDFRSLLFLWQPMYCKFLWRPMYRNNFDKLRADMDVAINKYVQSMPKPCRLHLAQVILT